MKKIIYAAMCLALLVVASPGAASEIDLVTLEFERITFNGGYGDQVSVLLGITQFDDNTLRFTFSNESSVYSAVTSIYFQDENSLIDDYDIQNSYGVWYYGDRKPGNLPGGKPYDFSTSFSMSPKRPSPFWGINPGESLSILMHLDEGITVASFLSGLDDQTFRIGFHVQGLPDGSSESFINTPPTPGAVPEPGTIFLLGSALLSGAGYWRRQRRKKTAKSPEA